MRWTNSSGVKAHRVALVTETSSASLTANVIKISAWRHQNGSTRHGNNECAREDLPGVLPYQERRRVLQNLGRAARRQTGVRRSTGVKRSRRPSEFLRPPLFCRMRGR